MEGNPLDWQPNGLLLSYPVITSEEYAHEGSIENLLADSVDISRQKLSLEKQITTNTPKTFLWHTVEDDCVPVENSLLFAQGLQKNKVPFELHIFTQGGHGLALATKETESIYGNGVQEACAQWGDLFALWVKENI